MVSLQKNELQLCSVFMSLRSTFKSQREKSCGPGLVSLEGPGHLVENYANLYTVKRQVIPPHMHTSKIWDPITKTMNVRSF